MMSPRKKRDLSAHESITQHIFFLMLMSIDHFSSKKKNCLKSKFWSAEYYPPQHQETINNMSRDLFYFFFYNKPKPIKPLSSSTMCSIINVWCFLLKHFFFTSFNQMNMRFIILDIYPLFIIPFILSSTGVHKYYYCGA